MEEEAYPIKKLANACDKTFHGMLEHRFLHKYSHSMLHAIRDKIQFPLCLKHLSYFVFVLDNYETLVVWTSRFMLDDALMLRLYWMMCEPFYRWCFKSYIWCCVYIWWLCCILGTLLKRKILLGILLKKKNLLGTF